jgi:acyl-[acyl-carrier-protein] desaturase
MKRRNWTPWDDLPLDEMGERGHLLSDDTVTIIQAYLGVEDFVGDYVLDGLNHIGKERERRDAHLVWGMEEAKHAAAWELVLLHSGRRTQKELNEYRDEVGEHAYRLRDEHPGLDTPMGIIAYTMLQERATFFNYDEMRKRIRQEYGLPERATLKERQRGKEIGAAGAFRTVGIDEIAHHGFFLELAKIYTRYLPEQMLGELVKVFDGFKMPALKLIPNSVDLEEAMRRTKLHTPRNQVTDVNNPVLDALGLDGRRALERAAQEAKILPADLGPQYVGISRSGEFVLTTQPDLQVQEEFPSTGIVFQRD